MLNQLTYCKWAASVRVLGNFKRAIHMGRIVPEIDPELAAGIEDESIDPKQLKTRRKLGYTLLPALLHTVAEDRLGRYADRKFRAEARELIHIMHDFKLPDDQVTLRVKKTDIETELHVRGKIKSIDEDSTEFDEDRSKARDELSDLIQGKIEDRRRDWHYYDYDERASLLYMAARLAPNYACLRSVMREIHDLDASFEPKSVLDFGSGMGTTIWAINETWPNEVNEFMNVEISKEQQYLCEYLLRGGKDFGHSPQAVFHRQYLPASNRVRYDMVVSAFSLLELPNKELRANTIENLWNKTNDFLVLIERGTRGGFTAINEARSFVLDLSGHDVTKKHNLVPSSKPIIRRHIPESHVFSPCPHEFLCPRAQMISKKNRDVCRFQVHFEPLGFGAQKPGLLREQFSYVVLRKKPHISFNRDDQPIRWPRIVEKRGKGSKQVIHRLCCPNGCLAEAVMTKAKCGKSAYAIAKATDWGDILPVKVCDTYEVKNRTLLRSGLE